MTSQPKIEVLAQQESTCKNSHISDLETKKDLIKRLYCKNSSDDELDLFIQVCKHTGLNPFLRQIYSIQRREKTPDGGYQNKMVIQTSIDGLRLIAERTGNYSPGKEPTYVYEEGSKALVSSTSYIKKRTEDGTWHEIAATAFYKEYVQSYTERSSGIDKPTQFWNKMPHVMLSKCAESLALRRAFPAEMSGIYSEEEMNQAEIHNEKEEKIGALENSSSKISEEQRAEIEELCSGSEILNKILRAYRVSNLTAINASEYSTIIKRIKLTREKAHENARS